MPTLQLQTALPASGNNHHTKLLYPLGWAPPGETASQCTAYQNKRGQSYTYCLMRRKGQFGHLRWIWWTIFLLLSQPNLLSLYPLGSHVSHSSRKSVPKTAKKTYEVVIRWKVTRRNYHILQSASHD